MKKIVLSIIITSSFYYTQAQNVGINTDGSTPDSDALLHINNHSGSGKDSSVVRIENEQNGANDVTGVEIYNSGTGATAKWDVLIPASGSTDLRISNNGTDRVTIQNDGDVGIGTTSPASGLDIQSSMGYKVNTITSATTLDNTYNVVLCNTGPYTVTLPAAASNTGRVYYIKNIDTDGDDITIDGNASETVEGSTTYALDSYTHVVQIISDGTNWHIIEEANKNSGTITGLTCGSATDYGTLTESVAASSVSSKIPYTGGNNGDHNGQTVTSTGVTGLTATLSAGDFASGAGSVTYNISGTPSGNGTASFALSIGGKSCTLNRTVNSPFTCGTSTVTWTYNGGSVTYGTVSSTTGECWMDRNLGASQVATSRTDANSYGDLFQWGRADDGHQDRTSSTTTTNGYSPGHGYFIRESNSPHDWRSTQDDNLWNGESATNNPCPSGWRIPTETEWNTEHLTWSSDNRNGAFASVLKLPSPGRRYAGGGSLNSVSTRGFYWSSTVSGTDARTLNFNSSSASMTTYRRAFGFSVRCLKD